MEVLPHRCRPYRPRQLLQLIDHLPSAAGVRATKTADEYEALPRHGCLVSIAAYHRKQHSLIRGATPPPASDPFGSRLRQLSVAECEKGFMDFGAPVV